MAFIICCLIAIISCLLNLHFLLFYNRRIITKVPSKTLCLTDGRLCHCTTISTSYRYFWKKIWPIYNGLIFGIIPCLIMTICCITIVKNLYDTRDGVLFGNDKKKNRSSSAESMVSAGYSPNKICQIDQMRSITLTLILLDVLFPLTIFPTLFFQIYINYRPPLTCKAIGHTNILLSFGAACTFFKNTFGFFIYLLTGSKFRKTGKELTANICSHT